MSAIVGKNGDQADVTKKNELLAYGTTKRPVDSAMENGQRFSAVIDQVPTAANDCFGYVSNHEDDDMVIESIDLFSDGASEVYVKVGSKSTVNSGTEVVPVNRLARSSKSLTDDSVQKGADLDDAGSHLTDHEESLRVVLEATKQLPVGNGPLFRLPKDTAISFWSTATYACVAVCDLWIDSEGR